MFGGLRIEPKHGRQVANLAKFKLAFCLMALLTLNWRQCD